MAITAAMFVFNEEKRLEDTLYCIQWCDEILVVDRNSTDATRQIALKSSARVIEIPSREFDPRDHLVMLENIRTEWVLSITASDVLTPNLSKDIRNLIEQKEFPYDVIHVPFRRYVLGLETKQSPWYSELNPSVSRRSVMKVNTQSVHCAVYFDTNRHYKMQSSEKDCVFHLTHEKLDIMMDRHLNYWRAEAHSFPQNKSLFKATRPIFSSLYRVIFKRKTFLMGWDGIALALAYLCYSMMQFVYIWERKSSKAPQIYSEIRAIIKNAWLKEIHTQ